MTEAPLPQWFAYAMILGQAIVMAIIVYYLSKIKEIKTAENYLTAGRNVGVGMVSASIIAAWVWAATLMFSSWTGYTMGFIGPWWYAIGAAIPLPLFAYLAISLKKKMPKVHSYPEFFLYRFDTKTHKLFSVIAFVVSCWVTVMVVTGGAITVSTFTGISFSMAAFIIVIAFTSYTVIGGLYGSIFSDTVQAIMVFVSLTVIMLGVYVTIGPEAIYNGLMGVINNKPVLDAGMTATAQDSQWDPLNILNAVGIGFLIVNTIGNLGAVFCDQSYWARAIAAKNIDTAKKAFWAGGLGWAPIPLVMGTALGVTGLALGLKVGETYVNGGTSITFGEAFAIAPTTAFYVLGMTGLFAFGVAIVSAILSTGSAELNAITTVFSNDIYRRYINPKASDSKILKVSKISSLIFAGLILVLSELARMSGVSMGFLYLGMGVMFSSAVVPTVLGLLWKDASTDGAFWGTIIGAVCGLAYWTSTGFDLDWGVVWGNIIVISVSTVIHIVHSINHPANFDWETLKNADIEIRSDASASVKA